MYPNPAFANIYVESSRNLSKPIQYRVYDMMGRPVRTGTSTKDNFEIGVEQLPSGVYTVQLYNGRDILILTDKVVIH